MTTSTIWRLPAAAAMAVGGLILALAAVAFGAAAVVCGVAAVGFHAVPGVDNSLGPLAGEWIASALTLAAGFVAALMAVGAMALRARLTALLARRP
jgi:hypothetical protein